MNLKMINRIFRDTDYVRTGGTAEEKATAEYIIRVLADMGQKATLAPFDVEMADIKSAALTVDGRAIPCKGYKLCGSGEVEAELYYLRSLDRVSLEGCRGKIVLFDGYLGYWKYQDIIENGAVGFISYDGDANYADRDIDQRELRSYVSKGNKILGVNINAKDAIELIKRGGKTAKISIEQEEYTASSHNVILDLPGKSEKTIVFTAHYDSTSLSHGAYDNMSGCVGLIGLIERFANAEHNFSLRFIFCGSEERGLLGSKAYCEGNPDELKKTVLCINLDMIGCIMGKFAACCTSENELVGYIKYMACELGFPVHAYQDVYSSDSTPFSDKDIPSVSFARWAPENTATIHNSYDTSAVMKASQVKADIDFIFAFSERMANSAVCPVKPEMPEEMRTKLDEYLCRKRKPEG